MFNVPYSLAFIAGLFVFIIFQAIKYYRKYKEVLKDMDLLYVDTSGITENPPKHYIEVWKGKTLNIKFNKFDIIIPDLPLKIALNYMERFAIWHKALLQKIQDTYEKKGLNKLRYQVEYITIYKMLVYLIYRLSYQFVKNKRKYKKELWQHSINNVEWFLTVCENILDYWNYIKKKLWYLSNGGTLQQITGENYSAIYSSKDGSDKKLIKPRFVALTNISRN